MMDCGSGIQSDHYRDKVDKLKRSQVQKQVKAIKTGLKLLPGTVVIPFSAETKQGRDEIWNLVDTEFLGKGTEE